MTKTILALILTTASTLHAERLRITVYHREPHTQDQEKRIANSLHFIFQHSEITLDLAAGALDAGEATLTTYDNFVNKEQEHRLACLARRDIAVAILPAAPSGTAVHVLGRALPFAAAGLNVQVYRDHIAVTAFDHNVPEADLVAHAIAHEIGHVLLRSTVHANSGLMAGVWSSREFEWITTGSMFFTAQQASSIRNAITGLGCPVTVTQKN